MPHHRANTKHGEHDEEVAIPPAAGESAGSDMHQQQGTEWQEKAAAAIDRALRLQAEMDNVRRRAQRDVENAHKFALEKFVNELLPIVDGLERALDAHAGEDATSGSLLDGVALTLKMLQSVFGKFGVHQVNPKGDIFNPEHHQAVSTLTVPNTTPGIVVEVLQKGYLLNDRLVRPALVVVAGA